MDCSKTLYAVLTVHMLIGAVLPMEGKYVCVCVCVLITVLCNMFDTCG